MPRYYFDTRAACICSLSLS